MKSIKNIYKTGKGPSSSHTIGPERAAIYFKNKYPYADRYQVDLFDSLSKTGKGHGTDRVLTETLAPVSTDIVFRNDIPEDIKHPNTLDFRAFKQGNEVGYSRVLSIGGGDIVIDGKPADGDQEDIYIEESFAEVAEFCRFRSLDLAEYVEFCEGASIWEYLGSIWETMKASIYEGLNSEGILPGGLKIERKAHHLYENSSQAELPQVRECRRVSAFAFAVSEQNADCGTIVTAPTCGSCGVIPASLYYIQTQHNYSDEKVIRSLGVAGLIGNLIKHNASISGAECGCQAEIGSACAMAAAALSYIFDQDTQQIQYAAEIALEHHLGLTCDPICGLVQVPCIERNAVAAMRAINSSNLAFFLSDTQKISFDIVVRSMYETGISMNRRFRETAEGGLAKMYNRRHR